MVEISSVASINTETASRIEMLADALSQVTSVELSRYHSYDMWVTIEDARAIMGDIPGDWVKEYQGDYVIYTKTFGNNIWPNPDVTFRLTVSRDQVCTRKEVGTKIIPASPQREVPIYEWECGPSDG
jgi:hypothetical protein